MKGDFTRDTFKPEKHYRQVLMQQGRVQLDADWNEQAAIAARRDETTTADLAGDCGGPAEDAAFSVITTPAILAALPAHRTTPVRQFALSAGRYYVDGIQCELESPFLFAWQPDHRENTALPAGRHLLYLDVWRRHLTALDDPTLRESALGGPDTATRVKTVWHVKAQPTVSAQCAAAADELARLRRTQLPQLKARTAKAQPDTDPCVLPVSAGYRGLENQLYRVEIHAPGAVDVATFKWSRENGSVVTAITDFTVGPGGTVLTVASTGPDDVLGFKDGNIVELIDDSYELEGLPGKLAVIDGNPANNKIKLKPHPTEPLPVSADIDLNRHAKLRRWEGLAVVSHPTANDSYLALERGVEILFDTDGNGYRTGDYWLIPARTASADATSGDIEWPRELDANGKPQKDKPLAQPPRGITHHYCRLGIITVLADGTVDATAIQDCRCLWPALTAVPRLFYVSGDGQEVMPDLTAPAGTLFKLPFALIVGVANAHCLERQVSIRFEVVTALVPSNGAVVSANPPTPINPHTTTNPPSTQSVVVPLFTDGLARCDFYLDFVHDVQQVTAQLLDDIGQPVSLPITFNARLSVARQVAYQPGGCAGLTGQKTVQDAIARLASMVSLHKVSGDGQQAATGAKVRAPIRVRAANQCGPAAGVTVTFQVTLGGGSVSPNSSVTDANGEAICDWQLGAESVLQVVEAEVIGDAGRPATEPRKVHFVAHLTSDGGNDPAPVRVVGVRTINPDDILANDETLTLKDFAAGMAVQFDRVVEEATLLDPVKSEGQIVRGQPTCFITAEIPYPVTDSDGRDLEKFHISPAQLVGYRPLVLRAEVRLRVLDDTAPQPGDDNPRSQAMLRVDPVALQFLGGVLTFMGQLKPAPDRLLLRLTLKGNFIWSTQAQELFKNRTPGGFLDGEALRAPEGVNRHRLLLPSGDQRRGGDFKMWFWLIAPAPSKITEGKTTDVKITDVKTSDVKVGDAKPIADVKVQDVKATDKVLENVAGPSAAPGGTKKAAGKSKRAGGKAFIRKQERPPLDPGTSEKT